MPDYPTDIKISEDDRNVFLDGTGDLATIGGKNNLEQSVAILVMGVTRNFIGSTITGRSVGLLEERVRQAINNDPQVEQITDVQIDEFDRSNSTITMTVTSTENEDFSFEVSA